VVTVKVAGAIRASSNSMHKCAARAKRRRGGVFMGGAARAAE